MIGGMGDKGREGGPKCPDFRQAYSSIIEQSVINCEKYFGVNCLSTFCGKTLINSRYSLRKTKKLPVVMMYIFVFTFFQGTNATVLPDASCNDVHFCLYIFSGYRCHGAPLGLQIQHGEGTHKHTDIWTSRLLDRIGPGDQFGENNFKIEIQSQVGRIYTTPRMKVIIYKQPLTRGQTNMFSKSSLALGNNKHN